MNPVAPRDRAPDVVLTGPSGVGDLPAVLVPGGGYVSEWEPTFDERKAILDGARIILWVLSAGHPPVAVEVEGIVYAGSEVPKVFTDAELDAADCTGKKLRR